MTKQSVSGDGIWRDEMTATQRLRHEDSRVKASENDRMSSRPA